MPGPATVLPLAHRDLGGNGLPPLVILHGLLGSSRNWQTAGADLATFRHVFALDLRNHGSSPHSGESGYPAMAADVAAWLDSNGLGRADLIGHSMGGKVAMFLACRSPERVGRLIVVDIAPRENRVPERLEQFEAMMALDLYRLKSRAEAERELEKTVPDWAHRKFLLTNLERTPQGGWRWAANLPVLAAAIPKLAADPLGPDDRYEGPSLFVAGEMSHYIGEGDEGTIVRHFPASRLVRIPGCGHNPHLEARPAFTSAVLEFISLSKSSSS